MSTSSDAQPASRPDPAAEDFYARLGVARDASPDAVRTGYRDAVRRHPPERDPEAFKRVREAFETLDDADARAEYDLLSDEDSPAGLSARAERAMGVRDYANAAHLFKRVLLDDPDAGRARNLLGLCFLYQGEPAAAAAQYDRLLAGPEPATVWLLNAVHAYREANRPDDARRALALAGVRPDADQSDVAIALADVEIDASDYTAAEAAIREGLGKHPPGDPGTVLLLLRRVDVTLHARAEAKYRAAVAAVEQAAAEIGWQQQAAYRLGIIAWKLIDAEAFALARPAAEAARRLQPEDLDYDALLEVATALDANDITRARQTVRTHVAFENGKWLHPLGPRVLAYCDAHAAYDGMKPVKGAPSLRLVNGTGSRLRGRHDPDARTGTYVSTLYFLFFFIPIFPIRRYRVRDGEKRGWHFLGVLPLTKREQLHRNVALGILGAIALGITFSAVVSSYARGRNGSDTAPAAAMDTTLTAPGGLPAGVPRSNTGPAPAPVAPNVPFPAPTAHDVPGTAPRAGGTSAALLSAADSAARGRTTNAASNIRGVNPDSVAAVAATDSIVAAATAFPPARDDFEARRRVLDARYFQLKRQRVANTFAEREIARARAALQARGGGTPAEQGALDTRAALLNGQIAAWRARDAQLRRDIAAFDADVDRSNAGH